MLLALVDVLVAENFGGTAAVTGFPAASNNRNFTGTVEPALKMLVLAVMTSPVSFTGWRNPLNVRTPTA